MYPFLILCYMLRESIAQFKVFPLLPAARVSLKLLYFMSSVRNKGGFKATKVRYNC